MTSSIIKYTRLYRVQKSEVPMTLSICERTKGPLMLAIVRLRHWSLDKFHQVFAQDWGIGIDFSPCPWQGATSQQYHLRQVRNVGRTIRKCHGRCRSDGNSRKAGTSDL